MAVTEESRHVLYTRLEETLGHDPATTLMESLPPVGWNDVATKQDIAAVRKDLDGAVVLLKQDIAAVRKDLDGAVERLETKLQNTATKAELVDKLNTHLLAVMGLNITLFGLCVGVVTLLR